MHRLVLRLALLAAVFAASPLLLAQPEYLTPDQIEEVDKKWPGTKRTSTGIRYLILEEGDGPQPRRGDRVGMLYTGWLLDGTKFDEKLDPIEPFSFRVGRGEVIAGWDHILPLMKLNEKRLIIVPGTLAYGARGRPPAIPRNATLVFEMKLIKILAP